MDEAVFPVSRENALTVAGPERPAYRRLQENSRNILALAALSGAVNAVCFTDAGGWGLNFPVCCAIWCVLAHRAAARLGLGNMRREGFWYGGILALALSIFWTANGFVQFVSAAGIVVLQCFWALSLAADVRPWHFFKAVSAVAQLLWRTLCRWLEPLRLMAGNRGGPSQWKQILLGLGLAFPMAVVALTLLSSADAVFRSIFASLTLPDSLGKGFRFLARALVVLDVFFALLATQTADPVRQGQRVAKRFPTLVAVTFLTVLGVIYVVFSAIQIRVLFLRGGGLPEGWTYAEYAREGFFQLLALSALNVLGVIVSQRRFESSRALRGLLCLISGCTFIMELSSAWRMILYVQVYGLTFLRLLVLWFLAVLAVILSGTLITVFRADFRLFSFSLVVCLAAWLVFAFARPDNLAAKYNLVRFGPDDPTLSLIRWELSADSVEELVPYLAAHRGDVSEELDDYLKHVIPDRYDHAGLRGFNYSLWRARQVSEEYIHG